MTLAILPGITPAIDNKWTEKEQTQAEVEVFILDRLFEVLPNPPFTPEDKEDAAKRIFAHVWQQSVSGLFPSSSEAA